MNPTKASSLFLILPVILLLVAAVPAAAHSYLLVDEQGNAMPINPRPDRPTELDLSGAQLVIRIMNSGAETGGCVTAVDGEVLSGTSVSFSGGGTTFKGEYTTPPLDHLDVIVVPTGQTGPAVVSVSWSASLGTCDGSGAALFGFAVEGEKLSLTSYAAGNTYSFGDPISLASGELHGSNRPRADLFLGGPLPLSFTRYYGSFLGIGGAIGDNWMHSFDSSLSVEGDGATVTLFGGKTVRFLRAGDGWSLSSIEKLDHQLVDAGSGGFRFLDLSAARIYTFDAQGRLSAVADRNGNALTVSQGPDGPSGVADGLGRSLSFTYVGGKITHAEDQTGRGVMYAYTGNNLTGITRTNGAVTTYSYTQQGDLTALMEARTLPDGTRPATQAYNAEGQVVSQTDGSGNTTLFSTTSRPMVKGLKSSTRSAAPPALSIPEVGTCRERRMRRDPRTTRRTTRKNRIVSYSDRLGTEASFTYHEPSGFLSGVNGHVRRRLDNGVSAGRAGRLPRLRSHAVGLPRPHDRAVRIRRQGQFDEVHRPRRGPVELRLQRTWTIADHDQSPGRHGELHAQRRRLARESGFPRRRDAHALLRRVEKNEHDPTRRRHAACSRVRRGG